MLTYWERDFCNAKLTDETMLFGGSIGPLFKPLDTFRLTYQGFASRSHLYSANICGYICPETVTISKSVRSQTVWRLTIFHKYVCSLSTCR